jgi:hypothetical protein
MKCLNGVTRFVGPHGHWPHTMGDAMETSLERLAFTFAERMQAAEDAENSWPIGDPLLGLTLAVPVRLKDQA